MGLPLLRDSPPPCFDCHAPCCVSYVVPITGFDLWRMTRVLGLGWRDVADVKSDQGRYWDCFRLDDSELRHGLYLRTRSTGACQFLLDLPGGHQRCGAHDGRPLACRIYPFKVTGSSQLGIELLTHAMCPPPQKALYQRDVEDARPMVTSELLERELYLVAVARWNAMAQTISHASPLAVDEFVEWLTRLYDEIAKLRSGPFESWHGPAQQLIAAFPMPELDAPGY